MSRLARLADALIEPLLVTYGVNVTYLTGFESSNCALLVEPGGETTLYSDFRYAEAAQAVDGVSFVQTKRDVVGGLAELLAGRRVAFEAARISYDQYETLGGGGIELMPSRGVVERLRAVKDEQELDAIRRACAISDEVYLALAEEPVIGRTDTELAWWIERAFRERGAEALAFESIVAAGLNGAKPHAHLGAEVIPADTLVTFDVGCVVDGYCSDCTRTFAVGDVSEQLQELHALCLDAQLAGLAAVAAGVHGREADAASRTRIEDAGFGWAYGHGMGHGVGLQIHEAPTLRPESTDVLEAGNVVSVEPGIYLPDEGAGVRIEDLVVVTGSGCERLTQFTKELIRVE
jgi:Xaa-Pro aminopeptidase